MSDLTHLDGEGRAHMVDVSAKPATERRAVARGAIRLAPETIRLLREDALPKGEALAVARIAGIMAAKKTSELIPLCHPLPITNAKVAFDVQDERVEIEAEVSVVGPTGVEMEALTAVAVAGLTVYDMAKAIDKSMVISDVRLVEKTKEPA